MKIYKIHKKQTVPLTIDMAWTFFSDPGNLTKITPEELDLRILTEPVKSIYPGLIIAYKIRPMLGIPITWVTEITHVKDKTYFIDEQRFGPYKFWHHEHIFHANSTGVEIEDMVYYSLGFGRFGEIIHEVFVKYELEKIFNHRKTVLENFSKSS